MDATREDPLRSIKVDLRSILVADQEPMTAKEVGMKFLDNFDYSLDPRVYNAASLDDLLQSMPDVIRVVKSHVRTHPNRYCAVALAATKDIESLVRRQLSKQQAWDKKERHNARNNGSNTYNKPPTQYGAAFRHNANGSRGQMPAQRARQSMVPMRGESIASRFSTYHIEEEPTDTMNLSNGDPAEHPARESSSSSTTITSAPVASDSAVSIPSGRFNDALQKLSHMFPAVGHTIPLRFVEGEARTLVNVNSPFFHTDYRTDKNCDAIEEVQLVKRIDPNHMTYTGGNVRNALESDLLWVGKAQNVLADLQRFDKVAVIQMVSPTLFLVSTCYGNIQAERFTEVAKILSGLAMTKGFRRVETFKPGMGCIIHQDGEYARAVLLSKARGNPNPGFLRFACMDMHAVAEVHYSEVFHVTQEVITKAIPCNLFLARIHGVGPIRQEHWDVVADSIAEDKLETGVAQWTPCIFFAFEHRFNSVFYVVDFVHKGSWMSELLLSNEMAPRFQKEASARRNPALTPTVVSDILEGLEKSEVFVFRGLRHKSEFALCDARLLPHYNSILERLCNEQPQPVHEDVSFGAVFAVSAEIVPNGHSHAHDDTNETVHHKRMPTPDEPCNRFVCDDSKALNDAATSILHASDAQCDKAGEAAKILGAYGWSVLAASDAGKDTALGDVLELLVRL